MIWSCSSNSCCFDTKCILFWIIMMFFRFMISTANKYSVVCGCRHGSFVTTSSSVASMIAFPFSILAISIISRSVYKAYKPNKLSLFWTCFACSWNASKLEWSLTLTLEYLCISIPQLHCNISFQLRLVFDSAYFTDALENGCFAIIAWFSMILMSDEHSFPFECSFQH